MTELFKFSQGSLPLLVSVPHAGTEVPPGIRDRLTDSARTLADTDWFVDKLYEFVGAMGASMIKANYSRYVIDLNRPWDDSPLYPGHSGTGLCPTTGFDGHPIYREGGYPDQAEIKTRLERYWVPYHDLINTELARLQRIHDKVLLWDGHSIRSRVPILFEGHLPDLNIGTVDGKSCSPKVAKKVVALAREKECFSAVLNGRFKGGYITRHYGAPETGVHAIQLEIAQASYMNETETPAYDKFRARELIAILERLVQGALETLNT